MVTFRDEDNTVSGEIDTLVLPTNAVVIDSSRATVLRIPSTGPSYAEETFGAVNLIFAATMNQSVEPIIDKIKGLTLRSASGTPLYGQTGHFAGGSSIKLGRQYGLLKTLLNPFSALSAQTGGITISLRAKLAGSSAGQHGDILTYYKDVSNRFFLFNDGTSIRIGDVSSGSSLIANVDYADLLALSNPINLFDGSFHHFVAVIENIASGRQLQFFIDGQLVSANNDASKIQTYGNSSTIFNIGGENNSSSASAIFDCDEITISDSAWTGGQVKSAYNGHVGISIATSTDQALGYTGTEIAKLNSKIIHVWKCDDLGGIISDHKRGASLVLNGANETLGVTGRWPNTTAVELDGTTDNARAYRIASFDGPDSGTEWAVSFDTQIDAKGTLLKNNYLLEMGDGSNTSAPYANFGVQGGSDLFFLSLNPGGVCYLDHGASVVGSGLWHTVTFGVRRFGNIKESFLSIDGNLSTLQGISWPDLSGELIDIIIGETLKFSGFGHRSIVGKIQNIVMWKGANFSNEAIQDLVDAQLQQVSV